ncbi:MAG: Rieske (2Fe-2S) protein, partial [SAR324 cluster bacterium]|nr:Rieske (2Fe-2S) protein [SAR324 cluster bacterium]
IRIRQSNLTGASGYVSLEDGCIGGFVERGIVGDTDGEAVLEMGGSEVAPLEGSRATETSVRGFWKEYRHLMGF